MSITITIAEPTAEERIRQRLESGRYADAADVVADALHTLETVERRRAEREEKLGKLRVLIAEADAEFERGEFYEGTPEFWDELEREALAAGPIDVNDLPEHLRP